MLRLRFAGLKRLAAVNRRGNVFGAAACAAVALAAAAVGASAHTATEFAANKPSLHLTQAARPAPVREADDGRSAEGVEVDVSTRSVAVTSTFSGTEIIAFGAVERSRQTSPEAGYYDVAIVFAGENGTAVVRSKNQVAGIWINTDSLDFNNVPSFYGIVSSRQLSEITDEATLHKLNLGFEDIKMTPVLTGKEKLNEAQIADFKAGLIRLKVKNGLFVSNDFGLAFVGKSLFRATMRLPANIPIGRLTATTYLFHDGKLLTSDVAHVTLERQGSERLIYSFARNYPLYYGLSAVIIAIVAGIAASAVFPKRDG